MALITVAYLTKRKHARTLSAVERRQRGRMRGRHGRALQLRDGPQHFSVLSVIGYRTGGQTRPDDRDDDVEQNEGADEIEHGVCPGARRLALHRHTTPNRLCVKISFAISSS